jgi:hypothetical protein
MAETAGRPVEATPFGQRQAAPKARFRSPQAARERVAGDMQRTCRRVLAGLGVGAITLLPARAAAALQVDPRARPVVVRVDDGFRWLDAGIGALAALGVVLLVVGFVLVARKGPSPRAKGER